MDAIENNLFPPVQMRKIRKYIGQGGSIDKKLQNGDVIVKTKTSRFLINQDGTSQEIGTFPPTQ